VGEVAAAETTAAEGGFRREVVELDVLTGRVVVLTGELGSYRNNSPQRGAVLV
jgi:hypothetical protein